MSPKLKPGKIMSEMIYNVLSGTLKHTPLKSTQSMGSVWFMSF